MSSEPHSSLTTSYAAAISSAELAGATREGGTWRRYFSSIQRAWVVILAVTAVGAVAGLIAVNFTPLSYRAQSTLWVEVNNPGEAGRGPIRTGELLQSFGWIELLRSFTVLDHTVRELHLYVTAQDSIDSPALASLSVSERYLPGTYRLTTDSLGRQLTLSTDKGEEIQRVPTGSPIGQDLGFIWTPSPETLRRGRTIEFRVDNIRDRAIALGERLETQMIENSNFLRLSLLGDDPDEVAATLQFVSDRYVQVAAELKRAKLDELTGVLANQLTYAEDNLRDAESSLEEFRIHTITLPSESASPISPGVQVTRDPVLSAFFDMRIGREQLRSDREAIDGILSQVNSGVLTVEAFSAVPSLQESLILRDALAESARMRAELRTLLDRYTEEHERVVRLRSELESLERQTIPAIVVQLRDQLVAQERLFENRITSASRDLEQIPPRAIEEARLVRRVEIANNLHATLRQRFEEARLATASSIPDIRVLDPAITPGSPLSDRRPLILLLSVLGAFGLGVAGVVTRERLDARVRYPEQITEKFGLPVLGAVPHVDTSDAENRSHVLEAFREVRLGLVHAHGAAGPMVFTVTSPESGDGKSFVASNLAMAFALRGDRTLIIDADVRRGKIHHLLGGSRTPGLTNFLQGRADLREVIQPTTQENLFMIGSGRRIQSAPELLASPRLPALLAKLRNHFDVIIFDSAPMGAGADAFVLATLTRDLLMVLRTGMTDGTYAEAKLGIMDRLPVRVLGAVLNDFVPGKLYRYYSYLPGYGAGEETAELLELPAISVPEEAEEAVTV